MVYRQSLVSSCATDSTLANPLTDASHLNTKLVCRSTGWPVVGSVLVHELGSPAVGCSPTMDSMTPCPMSSALMSDRDGVDTVSGRPTTWHDAVQHTSAPVSLSWHDLVGSVRSHVGAPPHIWMVEPYW